MKRFLTGGSAGNEQLTAFVATVLLVLLAIEGATLLRVGSLLTVHAFVGMLLVPVVALKLSSAGWRFLRYYGRGEDYVRRGPPPVVLRAVVAPVIVLSTIALLATGVWSLALGQTSGTIVQLHKASFIVWVGATTVHVLAHVLKLQRLLRARIAGARLRIALVAGVFLVGAALATATLPRGRPAPGPRVRPHRPRRALAARGPRPCGQSQGRESRKAALIRPTWL